MPAQPQDQKRPKAETANEPFEFKHNGDVYYLPAALAITGGMIRRHRHRDDLDMAFSILEEIAETDEPTQAAIDALDDMPAVGDEAAFNVTIRDWYRHIGITPGK
jgi:hypothetical protein